LLYFFNIFVSKIFCFSFDWCVFHISILMPKETVLFCAISSKHFILMVPVL
jgi:hypothetical protein